MKGQFFEIIEIQGIRDAVKGHHKWTSIFKSSHSHQENNPIFILSIRMGLLFYYKFEGVLGWAAM